MLRLLLHAAAISVYTLVFGLGASVAVILIPGGRVFRWFARSWARLIAWTCRTRVRIQGLERIPADRACVYMSNHQSHFDVIALLTALPGRYRILAKRELFLIPVFGWALWLAGMIPVDRSRRDRAIRSLETAVRKVRQGNSILVFAEGTRSEDGRLRPFKKGGFHLAMEAGAPIVPISVRGSREVLSRGSMEIRPGTIDVVFGDPIETGSPSAGALPELMARVRSAIESGLAEGGPAEVS